MSQARLGLAALLAVVAGGAPLAAGRQLERSVVRIVNHAQKADWSVPWDSSKVVESAGSGFVIEGNRILTNAHVVSDSRLLLIHVEGDSRSHKAEVVSAGHDCDLALVRPLDPEVLEGIPPLKFGGHPELGSLVDTLGFPAGGSRVSSTRGVVSRIEGQIYVHSGVDSHLAVQTDAAINPGNSGGPVVQDGRVVGVAFQNNPKLESVGFFIPTEVIARFLRDSEEEAYDGYPELGIDTENMQNPAARALAGMRQGETGVRVFRVYPGSSADGRIQAGDIILTVDGRQVGNDEAVADGDARIPYGFLIDRAFIGDTVVIAVLRNGERLHVDVPLSGYSFVESRRRIYDRSPRYFVYGGLVFVPLCREVLETYGADWRRQAPKTLLDEFVYRSLADPKLEERIVLLRKLDDPVNAEMAWYLEQIVERVNGRPIDRLATLIDAFESHRGDLHVIEYAHGRRFSVIDRRRAEAANAAILERYGIHKDRNP